MQKGMLIRKKFHILWSLDSDIQVSQDVDIPTHAWKPHLSLYSLLTSLKSSTVGIDKKCGFSFFKNAMHTSFIQRQTNVVKTSNRFATVLTVLRC